MISIFSNVKLLVLCVLAAVVVVGGGLGLYFGLRTSDDPTNSDVLPKGLFGGVASNGDECAQIGVDVLKEGGSAADSAIAVLFCEGVVVAQSMGLGGGCLMTIYEKATGHVDTLVAREIAPLRATADMFVNNQQAATLGGLAVAVPGELKGYWELHQKYGKLPWRRLVEPTIKLARDGFVVTPYVANILSGRTERIYAQPTLREVLFDPATNATWKAGDVMKRPQLARSLEIIADEGADAMYSVSGSLFRPLVEDIQALGGIITENDLLNYYARWDSPMETDLLEDFKLYAGPLPGSGILLTFIFDVLKGYGRLDDSPLTWHRVMETFKYAYAKRTHMADPDFVEGIETLISNLTSTEYAAFIRSQIDDMRTFDDMDHYGANFTNTEDHGTAHISVIAPNGDAVSVTSTVNLFFGAFIRSPQTGIIFNNIMDDFSTPGLVNDFGVPASPANYIVPGKRPMSSMTPAIVVDKNGDVQLVIGGAGGTRIPTIVANVILRHFYFNENLRDAMEARRMHHQLVPNRVEYETGYNQAILDGLLARGHVLNGVGGLATLTAIAREDDGSLTGLWDSRRDGSAIVFET